jgi:4-amino-4-deoxy-L-arabinose transferase-like glycosyltransferase
MFLLVGSPWYVAMTIRHAMAFINRFFIHDHLKRLAAGVHGENGTFQYFLEQFGYAAFPWVAFFPFALLIWPVYYRGRENLTEQERADKLIRLFMSALVLVSYVLFSMMVTKFHHYVFPMIIPAAVLIGLLMNDMWENRVPRASVIIITALVILIAVAQDLVVDPLTKAKGVLDGHTQLVGLFIYKYSRPYPDGGAFDFSKPLIVFFLIFGALFLFWFYARRRKVAIASTLLAGLAFSHFLNQHYMVQLAPHWTQKHLIAEYYKFRDSEDERLVAFQMNWKGENFYTGNRVIPYVSTKNKEFEKWLKKHRGERQFFITEHSRYQRMTKRADPASGDIDPLSDTCNKYRIGVAEKL